MSRQDDDKHFFDKYPDGVRYGKSPDGSHYWNEPDLQHPGEFWSVTDIILPKLHPCTGRGSGAGAGPRPSEPKEKNFKIDRDTVVPLLYGRRKIDGIPIPVGTDGDYIYICYVFCEGEIELFEKKFINDEEISEFSGLYVFYDHLGVLDEAYDTALHGCDSNWIEPLAGTAYVAARFKADEKFSGIPKLSAIVQGKIVYDHRIDASAYSSNPALCLQDLKCSARYGGQVAAGKIDYSTWDATANACDYDLGSGNVRHSLNYYIQNPTSIERIEAYMLLHFNGDIVYSNGEYKLNLHAARSSVATFDQDTVWDVVLGRPESSEYFNRVRASYTIPDDTFLEDEYSLESAGLTTGDELLTEANFDFTGCASLSEVKRLCVYQLNSRISDLKLELSTYDTQGLERFDRFTFSHDIHSLVAVDFYVLECNGSRLIATEYSADLFSDALVDNPEIPEADLPSPLAVPAAVTELSATELPSVAADQHVSSVVEITWTASTFAWVKHYEIWTKEDGDYILYAITTEPAIQVSSTGRYTTLYAQIVTVSELGVKSTAATVSCIIEGTPLLPIWKSGAALTGAEAGDVAVLTWDKDGASPIATTGQATRAFEYEIRRGRTGYTWDQSSWVATVSALNYMDRVAPSGTWDYLVKAINSMGAETATALSTSVTVTLNPNLSFNRNQPIELTGATVNQVVISPSNTDADIAFPQAAAYDAWAERFTGTAWTGGPSGHPVWMTPTATSGTIDLVTAVTDMGAVFSGEFTLNYSSAKIGTGTATLTAKLLYSLDNSFWTEVDLSSAEVLTARYLKAKFVWTSSDSDTCYYIEEPVTVNVKANPVIEFGTATVGSGGSKTITFDMTFAAIDKVQLTPQGSSARIALADNITTTDFDIVLFDAAGSAAGGDVNWKVEGV